ncbi:MAG TPA: DMT family transporter [Thermoanaerobaculia bacterium]|nr:DMT family transporter [Thermoanaerobaculia bacterium]
MSTRRIAAVIALLLVATAWGATFTLIKDVLSRIAPEPFIFFRFTLAGLVLIALAAFRRQLTRSVILPGAILGTLVFIGYWAQTRGLLFISPSRSALLTGLYVVMVPFFGRATLRASIASLLALIGTALLIGGFDSRPTFGDALTVFGASCFALHVVLSARYSTSQPALALAAVQVLAVGLFAAPVSLFASRTPLTATVIVVILFTALVTTALAFVALMWGQARVSATEAAIILSFEPVAAALTSILFYGEPVTFGVVVGGGLILAGMLLSQLAASPPG